MNQINFTEYLPYLFLLIGLILISLSIFFKSEKSKLKQTGIQVDGIVYEQEVNDSFNSSFDNSSAVKNKTTIRFVTQKEEWITGVIQQDFQLFYTGQYKDGETVTVYYDSNSPSHFYVDTKQSEVLGRIFIAVAGLVFLLIGLYKLFL